MIKTPLFFVVAVVCFAPGCGDAASGPVIDVSSSSENEAAHIAARELHGCYTPIGGEIRAMAYTPLDALGTYRVRLEHAAWDTLSSDERSVTKRRFTARGPLKGTVDAETGLAAHVEGSRGRDGFLFTDGDVFTPDSLDCFIDGVPHLFAGTQVLHYVAGAGRYAGLQAGGEVVLEGSINACPSDPEFGRVDFDVRAGEGELCFD